MRYRDGCPLCGFEADLWSAADPSGNVYVHCVGCGTVLLEPRLLEVISNARLRGIRGVLDRLPRLAVLSRQATDQGGTLMLTSTNWIRVASGAITGRKP